MAEPMHTAAGRLAEVLARENEALRAMDLPRAAALLVEKAAAMDALTAVAAAMPSGPPHPALPAAARRLESLAAENRLLLERALAAQQRVIGIIARAAASVGRPASYGPRRPLGARQARSGPPISLSTRA